MTLTIATVLLIAAIVAFALDAFRVPAGVSWTPLAWAFVMLSVLFGGSLAHF